MESIGSMLAPRRMLLLGAATAGALVDLLNKVPTSL